MNEMKQSKTDSVNSETTIVSGWSWIALAGLFLIAVCVYGFVKLLPAEEPGAYVLVGIGICCILLALWIMSLMFYRFRIDSRGVALERLVRRRFFPWEEIREVYISTRSTPKVWILTATFCKEVHRLFKKLDAGGFPWPKWCMCVDLDSEKFPSSKLIASFDQDQLLKAMEDHGIKICYDPLAIKVKHDGRKRKMWS